MQSCHVVCVFLVFLRSVLSECLKKDFTGLCPEGWTELDGSRCQSPLSYGGSCDTIATFSSEMEKRKFEKDCRVVWPCAETCRQDFGATECPLGWISMGDGVCDAPMTYTGSCLKHVRMWNNEYKQDFATRCGVKWPCQKMCAEDFGRVCPRNWFLVDGVCEAQSSRYTGPCPPFASLADFTEQDKHLFADLCHVEFPCKSSAHTMCTLSNAQCPLGWQAVGSLVDFCHGFNYEGPCRPLISVTELNEIGKAQFMETCAVEWECEDIVEPDAVGVEVEQVIHSGPVTTGGQIYNVAY